MDWHPRQNTRSKQWICSNGRWGTIYGIIELQDVHRNMLWTQVYRAWRIHEGIQTDLGEFSSGDAAAEACGDAFMKQERQSQ